MAISRVKIAPSLLSADCSNLASEIVRVEKGGAEVIHYDVMDGHFVPNLTIGPLVLESIRKCTQLPIDVHLMVENPDQYLSAFAQAGADWISVHVEACTHLQRTVQRIKQLGKKAGVALNPHTPLGSIEEMLPNLDFVLIMSVNPGFAGQQLIPACLDKISRLKTMTRAKGLASCLVEIDGGVKLENIRSVISAGADVVVSGSGIFGTPDPIKTLQQMKQIARSSID